MQASKPQDPPTHRLPGAAAPVLEFLAFRLGCEEYGVDIQKVQELRGYDRVTRLANAPDHVKGVINLRGIIVPIIDLRIRFSLGSAAYDQFTVVIVLNVGACVIGIVVDSVSDVIALAPQQIKPAPQMQAAVETKHLLGVAALDQRLVILLDIERLLTDEADATGGRMAA